MPAPMKNQIIPIMKAPGKKLAKVISMVIAAPTADIAILQFGPPYPVTQMHFPKWHLPLKQLLLQSIVVAYWELVRLKTGLIISNAGWYF